MNRIRTSGIKQKNSAASAKALVGIWTVTLATFIIAALYFARDILIPICLAALLTFLLAPIVTRLQKWFGRIGAVLVVVFTILGAVAGGGWILTSQLVDLASKLPDYQKNIQVKLRTFKRPTNGAFTRFSKAIEELKKDLPGATPIKPEVSTNEPVSDIDVETANPVTQPVAVLPVAEVNNTNPFHLVRVVVSPLIGPLGTTALVLLLVIFMLLKREDLRSRLIRLIGQGHISATTRAMDDAGTRVANYLLMQFILNVIYGVFVAIGLYFIGVPNAALWGATATALRFIPYVGPWIGAAFPVVLALAVSPGWTMPILTLGLFVALELLSNNVLEPWLYGSSTGVTPIALIFAALFWTWLWGPLGLVLATPMTVCLVVMGRHIPRLTFLGVLLSDQEALTPAEDCYYRLLTTGEQDELEFVENYLKNHSLIELYDTVFIPVITRVETDFRMELVDDEQRALVEQSLRDMVADSDLRTLAKASTNPEDLAASPSPEALVGMRFFCLPARASRDELAGLMLTQALRLSGAEVNAAPANLEIENVIQMVLQSRADFVCISVVYPSTVLHARYLCLKLSAHLPDQKIMVGLWGSTGNMTEAVRRVTDSGADMVVTTISEAIVKLTETALTLPVNREKALDTA
ncbi:MAG: AI-2E family transporter [Verrucomicrobiales bacterium]